MAYSHDCLNLIAMKILLWVKRSNFGLAWKWGNFGLAWKRGGLASFLVVFDKSQYLKEFIL